MWLLYEEKKIKHAIQFYVSYVMQGFSTLEVSVNKHCDWFYKPYLF